MKALYSDPLTSLSQRDGFGFIYAIVISINAPSVTPTPEYGPRLQNVLSTIEALGRTSILLHFP